MTEQKIHPDLGEKKRLLEQYVHVHGLSVAVALKLLGLEVYPPRPWIPQPLGEFCDEFGWLSEGDDL